MTRKSTPYGRRQAMLATQFAARDKAAKQEAAAGEATASFERQLLTTRLQVMAIDDGADATELLAALAVVIGTPCQAAASAGLRTEAWVRQMHGALRTIVSLCLAGYTWRADWAQGIDRAIEIASEQRNNLPHAEFTAAWFDANVLASRILSRTVTEGDIACPSQ